MMNELLAVGVAAALTENLVFMRGLGHGLQGQDTRRLGELLVTGGIATVLTVIAACCGWLGRFVTGNYITLLTWTRAALFVAIYSVAVVLLMVGLNFAKTSLNLRSGNLSTKLVYGFIPFGTLFVVGNSAMSFWQSAFYGAGAGVGFLLSVTLNYSLQRRLEHSDLPVAFRGMPITMLTFGMISLALFGLTGHPLAA